MIEPNSDERRIRHRVLAFAPTFLPGSKGGGPIRAIAEILEVLPDSVTVFLVTSDRDLGDREAYPGLKSQVIPFGRHRVYYWDRRDFKSSLRLLRLVRSHYFHLVFVNSLWSPPFTMLPWALTQIRIIRAKHVLLAPRGELSSGALGLKSRKKRLALATWGRLLARSNPYWQVSSDMEEEDVVRVFPHATTILQPDSSGPEPQPLVASKRTARFVFVSRIVPMKNLLFLLKATRACRQEVTLDIFGPTEDLAYWNECTSAMNGLPSHVKVRYRGVLPWDQVQRTLSEYDAFLFPTLGENFGFVIPESLSAGCPVVCSPHTPWTPLLKDGCGTVLGIEQIGPWTDEIDRRAGSGAGERTDSKRHALVGYSTWRRTQVWETAVERVLARSDKAGTMRHS